MTAESEEESFEAWKSTQQTVPPVIDSPVEDDDAPEEPLAVQPTIEPDPFAGKEPGEVETVTFIEPTPEVDT